MLTAIFSDMSMMAMAGYSLLVIGIIATALSSQRYLLLYAIAGMGYWGVIEVMQIGIMQISSLSSWHGYVAAMMLSWLPLVGWAVYRNVSAPQRQQKAQANYIEHTPIYKNYEPKYQ